MQVGESMELRNTVDQGVMWCLPTLDNLRFMQALYVRHHFKPHAHEHYVIGIVEAGVQSFDYKQEKLFTVPGKIIVINPDEVHTGEAEVAAGFAYRALYPTVSLMQNAAQQFGISKGGIPYFSGGVVHDLDLFVRLQHFHHRSEQSDDVMQLETQWLLLLADLIQRHAAQPYAIPDYARGRREVRQAVDYIEAHFADPILLADVAGQVHMSPFHLARMFHRQVGMPPHKYLENVRVREVEKRLLQDESIADIAYATGFSSQSHLSRTFKRFMGISPAQFRQQRKIV